MRESESAALSAPRATPRAVRWHAHGYDHVALYRLAEACAWLPRPARLALARRLGRLAYRTLRRERAVVAEMLASVTERSGADLEPLTAQLFAEFAMCFSDLVSTNRGAPSSLARYVASISGAEHLERCERGVVSVTAHVGNWELAGRLLATQRQRQTHVVVTAEDAPTLRRWVRRDGDGVRFVPRAHPAIGLELMRALRRGDVVALQGDRAIGTRGDVAIPFFGRPAPFPLGPFLLARAAGVPVVPAFCVLGADRRYRVHVEEPIRIARGEEEQGARTWVAALERVVRAHPTQWFNFFDVWRPFAG